MKNLYSFITCTFIIFGYCFGSITPLTTTLGTRVVSVATIVRYYSTETTRDTYLGANESAIHTVARCQAWRDSVASSTYPNTTVTWAFSWDALNALDGEYPAIRELVKGYVNQYWDDFSFNPSGDFAPMYNSQNQTNKDLHDALSLISDIVGGGYRPKSIIGGYLGAESLKYLAEIEDIHVAQATIFSQYKVDYGDGDGGSPYPYYPSLQHYLRPAQDETEAIDIVVLDGWTVDFLAARRVAGGVGFNSRMGVGPLETIGALGPDLGAQEQLHTSSIHFTTGFALNNEAFLTNIWEICLQIDVQYMTKWLNAVHALWPDSVCVKHGDYGLSWRDTHRSNDFNYSFVEIGSGIHGSDADKEITFYVNKAFRLVLIRDLISPGIGQVIDFTRYDVPAQEPAADSPLTRSWNLMNEINWKQDRGSQDTPRALSELSADNIALIVSWLPQLKNFV